MTGQAEFILYVASQIASTAFWGNVLNRSPTLDVPGMTEFMLSDGAVLGLMPEASIRALLGAALPDPAQARGVPRGELYLLVDDPAAYHARALAAGARELSPLTRRSWGDWVAYSLDQEGNVIAFASRAPAEGPDPWIASRRQDSTRRRKLRSPIARNSAPKPATTG